MAPPASIVPDLLRHRAAADPRRVALVVDGGESLTCQAWERRSNRLARGLADRGVIRGDRVALLFDNAGWTHYAVSYLGVHKAGAAAVPLTARFTGAELAHVLGHCGASAMVCSAHLVPAWEGGWSAHPSELEEGQSAEAFQVDLSPVDLAEVLYTSGTTGRPKGVACSHENILFYDPPPEPDTTSPSGTEFLHAFPIGTNAGQEALRRPLRREDATAVVLPTFDAERGCALVEERRITRLQLVPAMAQAIVSSRAFERHDVSSVRRVTLSSAPTPPALLPDLAAAFPNAAIWNTYALTEAGTARTLLVDAPRRPGSVGRPVGGTEVRIVDDAGSDVAVGQPGEVWLRREGAPMREYYRDPEATAAVFADGWVRTGDLGYLDADGYLYLVDRKKDVIVSGGFNVSSLEVEAVLAEHPAVVEAAVFATPHQVLGEDVAAAVVTRSPVAATALQAFVRERLAEHKCPHRIFFVEALPRNASGKVLKRALRDRFGSVEAEGDFVAPRTGIEEVVASAWGQVLGVERVGTHDDFFALGGHSLAAAQVVARLEEALGVTLPMATVFEAPTVAELAVAVQQLQASG